MKASHLIHCVAVGSITVVLFAPWLAAVAEEKAPPPKTHVLFMGADLIVQREKKLYRVEDVNGSEFMIRVGKQEVFVPTRNRQTGLQVSYNLRLSGASATLDQLQSGPAYTPENDPMRKLKEAAGHAASMQAVEDLSESNVRRDASILAAAEDSKAHNTNPDAAGQFDAAVSSAQATLANSQRQFQISSFAPYSEQSNVGAGANDMAVNQGNFDAMEVSFKVSSEVELSRPYMLILFQFHEPTAKPGVNGMVIHAEALDPIGPKPRYVRVLRGGLPLGFKFLDCSVHIYDRGREVATNASEKRVELTRDEAQQYMVMEYIAANKGATAVAAAMPGTLPLARRQSLRPDQMTRRFYAKISKDGSLLGAFADEDCNHPLEDADIVTALGEVFFKPALQEGKAVDGIARLRLSDF